MGRHVPPLHRRRVIVWHGLLEDSEVRVFSEGAAMTALDLDVQAWRLALSAGWTRPRWWQFWRWRDERPSPEVQARLNAEAPRW